MMLKSYSMKKTVQGYEIVSRSDWSQPLVGCQRICDRLQIEI